VTHRVPSGETPTFVRPPFGREIMYFVCFFFAAAIAFFEGFFGRATTCQVVVNGVPAIHVVARIPDGSMENAVVGDGDGVTTGAGAGAEPPPPPPPPPPLAVHCA
jgi:hypothetical protein